MKAVELGAWDVLIAASLLMAAGAISVLMQLGLVQRLAIAGLRTVLQLLALGLVLEWVFARQSPVWVAALMASMVVNAGIASVQRTEHRYRGIWSNALLAVSLSSLLTTFTVTEAVIGVSPWYAPRYLIPLLGMVLGNTLTGISLCLERVVGGLEEGRARIEGTLALGATIWEATRPLVRDGIRQGLIPILNSMSVVGLVSLPGMMTGQILAGADPMAAVGYQIVVMFMIAGGTSLGTLLIGALTFRRLSTRDHQLAAWQAPRAHTP